MAKKGGYSIVDLTSATIYADALKVVNAGKPVLVYDTYGKPSFADSISLDADDNIIINGSLTIASDNTISGDLEKHLYEYNINISGDDGNGQTHDLYFVYTTTKNLTIGALSINDINDEVYSTPLIDLETNHIAIISQFNDDSIELTDTIYNSDFTISGVDLSITTNIKRQLF